MLGLFGLLIFFTLVGFMLWILDTKIWEDRDISSPNSNDND